MREHGIEHIVTGSHRADSAGACREGLDPLAPAGAEHAGLRESLVASAPAERLEGQGEVIALPAAMGAEGTKPTRRGVVRTVTYFGTRDQRESHGDVERGSGADVTVAAMRRAMSVSLVLGSAVSAASVGPLGCGRLGLDTEERVSDAPMLDAPPPTCPADTSEVAPGAAVCIERVERGAGTWIKGDDECRAAGRRLCTDAEWKTACNQATGLVDMFNDGGGSAQNWEWMADYYVNGSGNKIALKRGLSKCEETNEHEVISGDYDFRCCVEKS